MDDKFKKYIEHLEFLGCKNTIDEENQNWADVDHPIQDFQLYMGNNHSLYHRVAFNTKKKLPTKKTDEIIRFMNYFNKESIISSSFLSENICICGVNYSGEYSKTSYGAFIEYFLKDSNDWTRDILEKFDDVIL